MKAANLQHAQRQPVPSEKHGVMETRFKCVSLMCSAARSGAHGLDAVPKTSAKMVDACRGVQRTAPLVIVNVAHRTPSKSVNCRGHVLHGKRSVIAQTMRHALPVVPVENVCPGKQRLGHVGIAASKAERARLACGVTGPIVTLRVYVHWAHKEPADSAAFKCALRFVNGPPVMERVNVPLVISKRVVNVVSVAAATNVNGLSHATTGQALNFEHAETAAGSSAAPTVIGVAVKVISPIIAVGLFAAAMASVTCRQEQGSPGKGQFFNDIIHKGGGDNIVADVLPGKPRSCKALTIVRHGDL